MSDRPIIPRHGGYRNLHAYKLSEVIHDATVVFCQRFIDPRSRTTDQMIQAARSGKQNIAEGSADAAISKKSELKLTGIARGSLVELEEDYRDYLRQHVFPIWDKDDPRCQKIRAIAFDNSGASNRYRKDINFDPYRKFFEKTSPEIAANTAICLINQATYLLNRLLLKQEHSFIEEGGFTENLYKKRKESRET